MSTQEMLLAEIKNQPEPVLREVWHYLRFLTRPAVCCLRPPD